jgi:hypothetical protein
MPIYPPPQLGIPAWDALVQTLWSVAQILALTGHGVNLGIPI